MKRAGRERRALIGVLCALTAALTAAFAAKQIGAKMTEQEIKLLGEQVRQAAVDCYASEGYFPQSVNHLVEHYGLVYDQERYLVRYDAFASNVMPDIDVILKGEDSL